VSFTLQVMQGVHLPTAVELSKYCELRHTDVDYLRMAIVDRRCFFQFRTLRQYKGRMKPSAGFENMLCTDDVEYVEAMREMLDDLGNRSLDISKVAGANLPASNAPLVTYAAIGFGLSEGLRTAFCDIFAELLLCE